MAQLNILKLSGFIRRTLPLSAPRTYEGAPAATLTPEQALRRSVMACMLWEETFYEQGESAAARIAALVPQVKANTVAALAVEARERMKLRHVPLLLVREMARYPSHRALVAETLERVIQRADELSEFVAIYWKDGRRPLSAQVKKGLAAAFVKFDGYALAKYDRAKTVRLRDVLFLSHAKPRTAEQAARWKQLIDGELPTPATWEVRISAAGADAESKREAWSSLLLEKRLGALALLRNLRNLEQAGVERGLIAESLAAMKTERVLPFRFLAAARHAPQWEPELESAMFQSIAGAERLKGRTVMLVDVSGSMDAAMSGRSQMMRLDAACGLAVLLRELADEVVVYTFSSGLVKVPPRRGFALRDAIVHSQPHQSTMLGFALERLRERYDRLIVITDEQSHDHVPEPAGKGYMINVASYRNGVGYGAWTHIDGFSESIVEYIRASEA